MKKLYWIALSLMLVGCEFGNHESVFVVPDGYRGRLVLVIMRGFSEDYERDGDRYIYRFPDSGVLCIGRAKHIINTLDRNAARYANGTEITMVRVESIETIDFDDVRMGYIGSTELGSSTTANGINESVNHTELWFGVGTSDDFRKAQKGVWSGEVEHATRHCVRKLSAGEDG